MKKLVVKDKTLCKSCRQCEVACSEAFYKEYDQSKSCIRITDKGDNEPKVNVCVQCGKCAKVCEAGAITQNAKGVYVIDKKKCTNCKKCIEECPFGVMVETDTVTSKCIACGICVKACPMQILDIKES